MRIILVLCVVLVVANSALASDGNGTAEGEVNTATLVKLGRKTNNPLLTLIGLAMRNQHPCELWSTWSSCDATTKGYFGTRTRTRNCVGASPADANKIYNETDIGLCEGEMVCPIGANLTSHGFCLQLHLTKLDYDEAEKYCENLGGYLINIDSEEKYQDVKAMLPSDVVFIYTGGHRDTSTSPWKFKYGSQTLFAKWGDDDPDNGWNDLCLYYSTSGHLWYDGPCTGIYNVLCEII